MNAIPSLSQLLSDRHGEVRRAVSDLLAAAGPAAVPALRAAAREDNVDTRRSAVRALTRIGADAGFIAILRAVGDPDAEVARAASAWMQRRLARDGARALLLSALQEDDVVVRANALRRLRAAVDTEVAARAAALLSDGNADVRWSAALIVQQAGDRDTVQRLVPALEDPDLRVRQVAAAALIATGERKAADILIKALETGLGAGANRTGSGELQLAARILGEARDARAVPPLIALLQHRDVTVAAAAAAALGRIGDKQAFEPLRAALGHGHRQMVEATAIALGRIRHDGTFEALSAALRARQKGKDTCDAYDAIRPVIPGFGALGDGRAVDLLAPLLEVRSGGPSESPVARQRMRMLMGTVEAIVMALTDIGDPRALDPIVARVKFAQRYDNRYEGFFRLQSVDRILRFERKLSIPSLIAILETESAYRTEQIAKYCGILGDSDDPRAVKPITARLLSDIPGTRMAAVDALRKLGPLAVPELVRILQHVGVRQRSAIAIVLAEIGPPALDPLRAALRHDSDPVRQGAAWAMGQMRTPDTVPPLRTALADRSHHVRAGAAWALGQCGADVAAEELVALLRDANHLPRRAAAEALGLLAHEPATDALIAATRDDNVGVRAEAVIALGRIGGARADACVRSFLADPNADVRTAAARVISGKPSARKRGNGRNSP